MKKFFTLLVSLVFVLSLVVSPVFAGGGKNQGDVGQGAVDPGIGSSCRLRLDLV